MHGEAFKCDRCGRVVFLNEGTGGPPPTGWFALSQVPENADDPWLLWHFDVLECLYDFVTDQAHRQESSPGGDDTTSPTDEPANEQVLSEWDAAEDPGSRDLSAD